MDSTRTRARLNGVSSGTSWPLSQNKAFSGNLQIVFPVAVVLLSVPPDHLSAAVPLPVDEVPDESFPLLLRKVAIFTNKLEVRIELMIILINPDWPTIATVDLILIDLDKIGALE